MVFISKKKINNKKRYYLEHSFRYPNKKLKKISLYLKNFDLSQKQQVIKKYTPLLKEKEEKLLIDFFLKKYTTNHIFSKETIKNIETKRLEYKRLIKKVTNPQWSDILDRFAVNFTYESNALEGNSLTLKDVTLILHENITLKGKNLREIYETKNTRDALDCIFKNKFKITKEDIIKLHSLLVKNTGVTTGFKKLPNFLLMRGTKTTPPEKVEEEITKLIQWCKKEQELPPLKKVAHFHGRFEKIHPFEDGNGRTGRMLSNIMLITQGYPPLIVRKTQRQSYFNALEAFDKKHPDKLERFFIEKHKETFEKFFKVYLKYLN